MAFTLTKLVQAALLELGELQHSLATNGTTTTIVDTVLVNTYEDGAWNGGTVFVVRDGAGAGAAPEGQWARVTSFAADTGTFTLADTLTAAVASTDLYAYAGANYPLWTMVEQANKVLREMGELPLVDTSLTTVAGQTEYAAAVAWKDRPPSRIDLQMYDDADDNRWETLHDWYYVPAAAGSTGLIVFREPPPADRSLRVWYRDHHPALYTYSDTINETLDPENLTARLVEAALMWMKKRRPGDVEIVRDLNAASARATDLEVQNPRWKARRRSKLLIVRGAAAWDDDYIPAPT